MKITKVIGDKTAEIHFEDGAIIFYSYKTPVAYISYDKSVAARTIDKYSKTTTKHINAFLVKHGFSSMPPENNLLNNVVWTDEKDLLQMIDALSTETPRVKVIV